MTNLAIKEVEFNGSTLMAAQMKDSEKVYVGVKWVSEGIGLTLGQFQSQTRKIQEDLVLKQGVANLQLPTKGGEQEVLCIELDFLPLWLAKISITPKMQKDDPEVVGKLVEYQLKAKDVLAAAFIEQRQMTQAEIILAHAQFHVDVENKIAAVSNRQERMEGQVKQLGERFGEEIAEEGYVTNDYIARELDIFSTSNRPHAQFINAVGQQLKIYSNRIGYHDDYVKVIRSTGRGGVVVGEAYYSGKGYSLIKDFVVENLKLTPILYKRGEKKGNFNETRFTLLSKTYRFNEKTCERYNDAD